MAASFPNAKKTFSAVVNGVTKLVAALFNIPDDEIEAIETFIGPTGGGAQSYSDSITNLLRNYREGCQVKYKSAADIYVGLGEIMVTDASGNRRLRRNTSDLTVNWTNIDTGTEATSTIYYVYAVADAATTTFTAMISTNATTPTGATFYRLLGSFYNNASGDIEEVATNSQNLLGSYGVKAAETVYQATTDGFVVGVGGDPGNGAANWLKILCDGSNPPTTVIAQESNTYPPSAVLMTLIGIVKKGQYWKATASNASFTSLTWIPLGV